METVSKPLIKDGCEVRSFTFEQLGTFCVTGLSNFDCLPSASSSAEDSS
jgi:hypothetical protein